MPFLILTLIYIDSITDIMLSLFINITNYIINIIYIYIYRERERDWFRKNTSLQITSTKDQFYSYYN